MKKHFIAALIVIATICAIQPAKADLAISGFTTAAAGVATWLGTPTSANLATALTDETGSGALVFATGPTLTTPVFSGTSTGTWTLGGTPTFFAGGGTQTTRSPGVIYWERPNLTTTASSAVPVLSTVYVIPANTLSTAGDSLLLRLSVTLSAAQTDAKTWGCNIGYSAINASTGSFTGGLFIGNGSSANLGSSSILVEGKWNRHGASNTTNTEIQTKWGATTTTQGSNFTSDTGSIDWTVNNNFLCEAYNSTPGTQTLTLNELSLTYLPK